METIKDLLKGANPIIILLLLFLIWWVTNHIPGEIKENSEKIDRLETKMNEGFSKMDERFSKMDERFSKMDERFSKMDDKFDALFFYLLEKDPKHLKPSTNK